MDELLHNAKEELKRVDHLIYVSLKYTRTCDVLKNVIDRLISAYDCLADALLAKAVEEKRILDPPNAPKAKAELALELYAEDPETIAGIRLYLRLRRIASSEYERENEYRRHVAMVMNIDREELKVSIDLVTEYYKQTKQLIEYIEGNYFAEQA